MYSLTEAAVNKKQDLEPTFTVPSSQKAESTQFTLHNSVGFCKFSIKPVYTDSSRSALGKL